MNDNFEVEQTSINILKSSLPSSWRFREQHPDYHIDYVVEIPPGSFFGIQLKGRRKLTQKKNQIKIQFSVKQLKYYLDDIKSFPVFIIVVDVINRKIYWLFIQEYLKEKIVNKHWRSQKNVTLTISTKNSIDNIEVFKNKIVEANNYVKELWPSSLLASAKKEKEYFRNLDPRFKDISITIKNETVKYHFQSDESFDIKFKVKDDSKLKEYLRNPKKEKFVLKPNEVDVIGSDLMSELLKKSDKIEFNLKSKVLKVDVALMIVDHNNLFSDFIHFDGHLSYSQKRVKIDSIQKDSPLKVQTILDPIENKNPTFGFNFDFTRWMNKPIQFLPFLEKLNSFFDKLRKGKDIAIKIDFLGNNVLSAKVSMKNKIEFLDFTTKYISLCKKLKDVDLYYNLNLLFPGFTELKWDDKNDIEELYDLMTKGEYIERRKLTGSFEVERKEKYLELYKKGIDVRLISDGSYILLGKKIDIGEYAIDISRPKLLINNLEMEKLFKSDKDYVPLKFTTDEESKVIIRKLDKEK